MLENDIIFKYNNKMYTIIDRFSMKDKNYIIYKLDDKDDLYAALYKIDDNNNMQLFDITNEEDYDIIDKYLEKL